MAEPAAVLRAAGFLALLMIAGCGVAGVGRRRVDAFAATWWGLALTSVAGVILARAGRFSLLALAISVGAAALGVAAIGRGLAGGGFAVPPVSPELRRVRRVALGAGIVACAWCWPPFETYMAASDSTMYVDAGVHLARTGSYEVADSVARLLPPDLAQALFRSVGLLDQGPYIRLPGGLLMSTRDAPTGTPAFFPLVSVWTGVLAAVGGPDLATAVAPLGMSLAVWALTLFAGETMGLAVAVPTAVIFLGNFAVWWFGRFPMSEPFTIAFVWGSFVFLARGAPLAAGVMLGIGGVARAETLVFAVAAVMCWWAWTAARLRDVLVLAASAAAVGVLAAIGLFAVPNHHVAYLKNDLGFAMLRAAMKVLPALWDGRLSVLLALLPLVPLSAATVAVWRGTSIGRGAARIALAITLFVTIVVYLRLGGRPEPLRHLGWLASSMSPLGLALGIVGCVVVWRRGDPAARLALVFVALVAAAFIPSPRVASYQPWAMRRFLPIVLPGLALGAGAVFGTLVTSRRRMLRVTAVVLGLVVVGLQVRPVLAVRHAGYYGGSLASVGRVAALVPAGSVVVVDGGLADLQIQVPLWLVFERETVLATAGGPAWRVLLAKLIASGRPVYWIQNRWGPAPQAKSLVFTPVATESDITIHLPDSPANEPPAVVLRKIVPLRVYGVAAGEGDTG